MGEAMSVHRLFIVDAFTDRAYEGNPCAVVLDANDLSSGQMQRIAREMNLSETAFVLSSSTAAFGVRFFTPRKEIPYAGHPTIATAYTVASQKRVSVAEPSGTIEIEFPIGVHEVRIDSANGRVVRIVMTQPAPTYGEAADEGGCASALGLAREDLLSTPPPQVSGVGVPFLMIGVASREVLLSVRPEWDELEGVCRNVDVSGAYVYALGGSAPDVDLCARFFDPFARYEDPFTGSACGAMAALARRDGLVARDRVTVEQGEAVGRIGRAEVDLHEAGERLRVGGSAALVASGTIVSPSVDGRKDGDRT